jgi:hypothetical protein
MEMEIDAKKKALFFGEGRLALVLTGKGDEEREKRRLDDENR